MGHSVVIRKNVYSDVPKGTVGIIKENDNGVYTILTRYGYYVFESDEIRPATERERDKELIFLLSKRRVRKAAVA